MKSKYLVVLAIVVAMLMLGLCAGCATDDSESSEGVTPSEPTSTAGMNEAAVPSEGPLPSPTPAPTPTPEPTPEPVTQLPPLESVTVEDSPLLYDFMHRCLGWHVSPTGYFFVLHNITTPNILYSSTYTTQGQVVFPTVGDAVARAELSEKQLEGYRTILRNAGESDIYPEGDWVLLSVTPYMKEFAQLDITFTTVEGQSEENPFVSSGEGWPTEWLRREPYASAIKEAMGLNVSDSWWDTWRYLGKYDLIPTPSSSSVLPASVVVTGYDRFTYTDKDGNVFDNWDWDWIRDVCDFQGRYIDGIYDPEVGAFFDEP